MGVFRKKTRAPDGRLRIGRDWWIEYYVRGRRKREKIGPSKRLAEQVLAQRKADLARGKVAGILFRKVTFEELTADLFEDYRANQRKSLSRLHRSLKPLGEFFAGYRAEQITPDAISRYVAWRRRQRTRYGAPPKNATLNRELAALKRMMNLAVRNGKLAQRPVFPKRLEERNVRSGFIEEDTLDLLLRALPHYLRPLVTAGFDTGMRAGELLGLVWEDSPSREGLLPTGRVNVRERRIRLDAGATKNDQGREIVMTDNLYRALRLHKDNRDLNHPDCPWVFFRENREGLAVPIRYFRRAWESACKRVGLEGLLFHDLRRSAVRRMIRAGIPERVAMEISGHKTRSVFDRYNIVSDSDLLEAARRLNHFGVETANFPDQMDTKMDTKPHFGSWRAEHEIS